MGLDIECPTTMNDIIPVLLILGGLAFGVFYFLIPIFIFHRLGKILEELRKK